MFFSLAIIMLFGFLSGELFKKLHLPALMGMLAAGIIIGPYALNLIDGTILGISSQLRKIALIIILTRAGLSFDISALKKNGRPAILMCFVPACFEILGMIVLAPIVLGITRTQAAIMGAVVGAVSPAVIVPKMLKLTAERCGTDKGIPQLIMAGASVDDIFVIVMFSIFIAAEQTGTMSLTNFLQIPVSIISGIAVGFFSGFILNKIFMHVRLRDTVKIIFLLSFSFLLTAFEDNFSSVIPFSAMLAVMCMGASLQKNPKIAERLSVRYNKLWVVFEILLFVLVGACVNLKYAANAGLPAVMLIFAALIFRMAGVCVCLVRTRLSLKERLFCMLSYLPKATVQAAIGGIPLSIGLSCGEIVLTVAVLSIIITAPLGAFLIDLTYKKLLNLNVS